MPDVSTATRTLSPGTLLAEAESRLIASDLDEAKLLVDRAMALSDAVGDDLMHARAVALRARVHYVCGESAEAMGFVLRAVDLSNAVGDLSTAAEAHEVAARVLLDVGETGPALDEGLKAVEAAEGSGDLTATMSAMRAMTNVYASLHQWDKALEFGERYHEIARLVGDRVAEGTAIETISFVYGGMAVAAAGQGDHARAADRSAETVMLARTAMLIARDVGNRRGEMTCLGNLAESLADVGRHAEALALLDDRPIDPRLDPVSTVVHHRMARGVALAGLGRREEAAELLELSVSEAPTTQHEMAARRALAALQEEMGDLRGALDHHKRLFTLVAQQMSEQAQRAAGVAAVRLETAQAKARAMELQTRAAELQLTNDSLSRHSEDLRRQALEDPLTGLPNRRRLDELLASDLRSCSVVLLDIDHFKRVNDEHSHLLGDAVLRVIAKLLRDCCRGADTPLRFGGEEFALVTHGASVPAVLALSERMRSRIESYDWAALAPQLAVTASFGAALGSEAATSIELLALADRRLLQAKQDGRNRVLGPPTR
ncbi:tetratricopeptide repeat-containing diguanylate cyclase [Cellulomonas sp. URHB0016]